MVALPVSGQRRHTGSEGEGGGDEKEAKMAKVGRGSREACRHGTLHLRKRNGYWIVWVRWCHLSAIFRRDPRLTRFSLRITSGCSANCRLSSSLA